MQPLSNLLPQVLPDLDGCSDLLALRALQNSNIRLHEETSVLTQQLAEIPLVVDQPNYTLSNPTGFQIIDVRDCQVDKILLTPTSEDQLDLEWAERSAGHTYRLYHHHAFAGLDQSNWREAKSDQPRFYYMIDPNQIRLVAIPTTVLTNGIDLRVGIKPTLAASHEITDWLFEDYYLTIVLGALAELYAIPKKTWSDKVMAGVKGSAFDTKINKIRAEALRGYNRNDRAAGRVQSYA